MFDTLLIIEDESLLGNELARHYRGQGWEVNRASTLEDARRLLFEQLAEPLVVLSDMNLPDGNALNLLEQARKKDTCSEWCFLTGHGTVADSVRALRLGAYDFVEKRCELDRLDMLVEGTARTARAQRRLRDETDHRHRQYTPNAFVGSSPAVKQLRHMIMQLAKVPYSSLVITGETGTGKGLTARILHYSGTRSNGPLIELNCAALPRELIAVFIDECNAKAGKKVAVTPDSVWRLLEAYDWPGNVRELHNVIERCVLLADDETFPEHWMQLPNLPSNPATAPAIQGRDGIVLPLDGSLSLEDMDRFIIEQALHKTNHNVTAAAKMLGTTRETLRYRVRKYQL